MGPTAPTGVLTLALFGVGALTIDGFAHWYSVSATLTLAAFVGVAAVGQTMVMLLGTLDLSIPFLIGMGNVGLAGLLYRGWPFGLAAAAVLGAAAVIGAVNGFLSERLSVSSVIVTLGTGVLVQGLYLFWTAGQPVGGAPRWLSEAVAPGSSWGPLPVPDVVVLWAAIAAVVVALLRLTVPGRLLYATGANPTAARLALVRPTVVWTATFGTSAVFAALAGMLLLGFTGSAAADVGDPYFFATIAAVALGGTSIRGGQGGYGATLVGAVLLAEISLLLIAVGSSLPGRGSSDALSRTVLGLVIIAIAAFGREPHVRTRI